MSKTFDLISNKRSISKYEIYDTYEAGLVLKAESHKKIFNYQLSLTSAYGWVSDNEIFIKNFYQEPIKLLLHKSEIRRIIQLTNEKKYLLIPKKVYIKNHKVKIEIALAKLNKNIKNTEKLNKLKEKSWKKLNMNEAW